MALFEIDNGRLVPAQFGYRKDQAMGDDVLAAVRAQILDIVQTPLFPVAWSEDQAARVSQLTALDPSGQVTSVEVVDRLDSESFIGAMQRLGQVSGYGWVDIARLFPGGADQFRAGWAQFREALPPAPGSGPRLVIVTGEVAEAVMPSLEFLAKSGVEVIEVSVREMSNGRQFLDVQPLDTTWSASSRALAAAPTRQLTESPQSHGYGPGYVEVKPSAEAAPVERPRTAPAPEATPSEATPAAADTAVEPEAAVDPAALRHDPEGLQAIALVCGEEVPVFADGVAATLTVAGAIDCGDGTVTYDPDAALAAVGVQAGDAWQTWRLGDPQGPTLAEAIAEINLEIAREKSHLS